MSDKAETTECVDCSGRGFRGVLGGLCPTCSGTGVRTTGAVAANDYGEPQPTTGAVVESAAAQASCVRCGGEGVLHEGGVHELCPACQGTRIPPRRLAVEIASQSATIAAQAAEIETLTTDRDVLRLEVQRLKDLNFESQDLYAAIEAERDELRAERLERIGALEAAMRTIDAQNAQVRAMNVQLDVVTQLIVRRVKEADNG